MLYGIQWLEHLQRPDPIYRPYKFDQVEIEGETDNGESISFCIIGPCYSEYASGPSLLNLADVAGYFFGPGFYGLKSCRKLGFRA